MQKKIISLEYKKELLLICSKIISSFTDYTSMWTNTDERVKNTDAYNTKMLVYGNIDDPEYFKLSFKPVDKDIIWVSCKIGRDGHSNIIKREDVLAKFSNIDKKESIEKIIKNLSLYHMAVLGYEKHPDLMKKAFKLLP